MTKNFTYYMLCWLAFGAIGGMLMPVYSPATNGAMSNEYFWAVKMSQAAWGLLFGATCGVIFTLLQNTWNKDRSKMKSRIGAIGIWMSMKFAWAGIAYLVATA